MKLISGIYVIIMISILSVPTIPCFGQNNRVNWYSFNSGYGMPSSASMQVHSIIGQQFVGQTGDGSIRIQSGFIMGIQLLTSVGISDGLIELPFDYSLNQNYPNPFNPATTIKYGFPKKSNITLIIYNLMGREIIRWDEQNIHAGLHEKVWDGRNKYGESVASGIYFYRLRADDYIETRKMVLLR